MGFALYGTAVRNRQRKQPRGLCCDILTYSVFALPQPLLSASSCMIYCCSADMFTDSSRLQCNLAVKGGGGYGRNECVLAKAQQLGCDLVGMQETSRPDETAFYGAEYRVVCCGQQEESPARQGSHGVGLVVKESICCKYTY